MQLMPELSVIVSNYNNVNKLKLCLNAYRNQTLTDFEIIVASDGSSDESMEYVKSHVNSFPFKLKAVWHVDSGYRLARIRNCAWRIAQSDRVIFTDQDLVPNADLLANYARFKNTEVALAGYIGWIDECIHKAFTEDSITRITNFEPFMTQPEQRNLQKYNSWVLWGGNLSVLRNLYEITGGFDEDFQAWGGEDTDLGVRCDLMKYRIKTLPEAKVFHLNHPPSNSLNRAGSDLFFKKKRYEKTIKRNIGADYSDVVIVE